MPYGYPPALRERAVAQVAEVSDHHGRWRRRVKRCSCIASSGCETSRFRDWILIGGDRLDWHRGQPFSESRQSRWRRHFSLSVWSPRQLGSVKRRAMMSAATEDRVRPFA